MTNLPFGDGLHCSEDSLRCFAAGWPNTEQGPGFENLQVTAKRDHVVPAVDVGMEVVGPRIAKTGCARAPILESFPEASAR